MKKARNITIKFKMIRDNGGWINYLMVEIEKTKINKMFMKKRKERRV
jgi:hypothetical protein